MATDSKKKLEGSKTKTDHPGLGPGVDADRIKPIEPIFAPEQHRIPGQVYQLILSWRLEPKMQPAPATSSQLARVEVEA